jgi:hypothetical protein
MTLMKEGELILRLARRVLDTAPAIRAHMMHARRTAMTGTKRAALLTLLLDSLAPLFERSLWLVVVWDG